MQLSNHPSSMWAKFNEHDEGGKNKNEPIFPNTF